MKIITKQEIMHNTKARLSKGVVVRGRKIQPDNTIQFIEVVINDFMRQINLAMINKDKVCLRDFGSFRILRKKAKPGRNPRTNMPMMIPPKNYIKFLPSRKMGARINA